MRKGWLFNFDYVIDALKRTEISWPKATIEAKNYFCKYNSYPKLFKKKFSKQ